MSKKKWNDTIKQCNKKKDMLLYAKDIFYLLCIVFFL